MKIILSRKGFDSRFGGAASPVMVKDNKIISFPIPVNDSNFDKKAKYKIRYNDLELHGHNYGKIVEDLTVRKQNRIKGNDLVHLDPDIIKEVYKQREPGWKPLFGQVGAAQSHLNNQKVGKGDIFLFFGLYRWVEQDKTGYRYVREQKPFHMIWGWMQIEKVIHLDDPKDKEKIREWMKYHPHFHFKPKTVEDNTLYVGSKDLIIDNKVKIKYGGCGTFKTFRKELQLTKINSDHLTDWVLPACFYRKNPNERMTYHKNKKWILKGYSTQVQAANIGQEFVLDIDRYNDTANWLIKTIDIN